MSDSKELVSIGILFDTITKEELVFFDDNSLKLMIESFLVKNDIDALLKRYSFYYHREKDDTVVIFNMREEKRSVVYVAGITMASVLTCISASVIKYALMSNKTVLINGYGFRWLGSINNRYQLSPMEINDVWAKSRPAVSLTKPEVIALLSRLNIRFTVNRDEPTYELIDITDRLSLKPEVKYFESIEAIAQFLDIPVELVKVALMDDETSIQGWFPKHVGDTRPVPLSLNNIDYIKYF